MATRGTHDDVNGGDPVRPPGAVDPAGATVPPGEPGWGAVAGAFFAAAPAGIAVVDAATGAILDANPALCALLGRSRGDLLRLTVHDITLPQDREVHAAGVPRRTLEHSAPIRHEKRFLRGDGSLAWGALTVTPLPAAGGPRVDVVQIEAIAPRTPVQSGIGALPLAARWLLEHVPAAVFIHPLDPDLPPTYVSPRMEEITGYRMEDLLTQRDFLMPHIHPDDVAAVSARSGETDRTLQPFVVDYRFRRKDGRWIWLHNVTEVVRDEAGTPLHWQGYVEDITARREAEDALRDAEALHRGLVEQIPAAVYTLPLDPELPPIFVSPRIEALIGRTPAEVSRSRAFLLDLAHPDDVAANLPLMEESDRTLQPCTMRYRIRHTDGRWVWLLDTSEVVFDERGDPVCWQGLLVDVTAETELQEALAASEALFRSTFEDAAIGMALVGPDARIIEANPAFQTMLGCSDEELRGLTYHELSAPAFEQANAAAFARLAAGETDAFRLEKQYRRKDGTTFWGSLNVSAVRDAEGRLLRAISQVEDISAAKEAELRYRRLVEQIPAAVFTLPLEPGAPPTFISPRIEEITGYRPDELPAEREFLRPFADDGDAASNDQRLAAAEAALEPCTIQYRLRRKDGRLIWVLDSIAVVRDDAGQPLHWQGVLLDVTAEKEAELALANSEALFRASFENAAIGMALSDGDGGLTDANPAFCRLLGYTRDELLTRDFAGITHPDDLAREWAEIARMVAGDVDSYRIEKRFLRKDGAAVWVSLNASCVRGPAGGIALGIAQVEDIAARKAAEAALAESEALFRSAFADAAVGMGLTAPDGRTLAVNPALCRMLGYSEEELRRLSFADFTHPDDLAAELELFGRLVAGEIDTYRIEKREIRKDGGIVWIRLNVSAVRGPGGELLRIIGQVEDISAVKAAQEALAASAALFRSAFEDAAVGMALATPNGLLTDVNPAFCRMLGRSRDDLLTMDFAEFTHPDDLAREMIEVERLRSGEIDSYRLEKRYVRKDGGIVWVNFTGSCVRRPDGGVELAIGQVEDITARKAAEAALAQSEELFRTTVHQSGIATGVADATGHFIDVNEALAEMTGYGRDELLGMAFADLGHPEDNPAEQALFRETMAGDRDQWVLEKRLVRKDGSVLWAWVNVSAVRNPDGGVERLIGQVVDVTAVREAQRALADALDLQRAANDELVRLARQRAEFLAMLAHDFRTPLTAVQGYGDLLLLGATDPETVREYARTISGSAERLNRMVSDLLAVETMEDRLGQLHLEPTDVGALVADAVSGLRGAWRGREIAVDAPPDLPDATLDRDQLTQAVTNLIGNALKYSPAGEPVMVAVRQDGPAIELAVADRGIGIPADKLERIFDKYARVRTKETHGIEGVGLGLPIVRAIARAHGGDAWAESAPGEGSTFRLRLPIVPPSGSGTAG